MSIALALDLTLTALQTCLTWLISVQQSSLPLHFTLTVTRARHDWNRPDPFTSPLSSTQRDWSSPQGLETSGDAGELKKAKGKHSWVEEEMDRMTKGLVVTPAVMGCRVPGLGNNDSGICLARGIHSTDGLCWGWPRLHRNVFNVIWYIHLSPSTAHVIPQSLFYWRVYTKQALTLL